MRRKLERTAEVQQGGAMKPISKWTWMSVAAAAVVWVIGAAAAKADLIFPPGATLITGGSDEGSGSVADMGISFTFYTNTYTSLGCVENNGFIELGSGNHNDYNNTALSSMGVSTWPPFIAALWDDLNGDSGIYGGKTNNCYAVTWTLTHSYSTSARKHRFQICLFGGGTSQTVAQTNDATRVFTFKPGDIAIAYDYVSQGSSVGTFDGGNATVGILDGKSGGNANGTGYYKSLPGKTDGLVANADVSLLPTNSGTFMLFRPDATGTNYSATIEGFAPAVVPSVSTLAASNTTAVSVTLNGSVASTGAAPTFVSFLWGPTDQGTNVSAWANTNAVGMVNGPGGVSTNLSGLSPATTYYYVCYATNSYGTSVGAPSRSFTTLVGSPTGSTAAASSVRSYSATMNGSVDSVGAAPTTALFLWGTTDGGTNLAQWANTNWVGVVSGTGSVSSNLSGLTTNTNYYYIFCVTNIYGTAFGSPSQSFTTWSKPATLVADYRFNGDLKSSVAGAPDLVFPGYYSGRGAGTTPLDLSVNGIATFGIQTGFELVASNVLGLANCTNYTVAMRVKVPNASQWNAMAYGSPNTQNTDDGFFIEERRLSMWYGGAANNVGAQNATIADSTWTQLIYSVKQNASDPTKVDLFGMIGSGGSAKSATYVGLTPGSGAFALKANDERIEFFRAGYGDNTTGSVDRIQVYIGAMTTNEAAVLDLTVEAALPPSVATSNATSIAAYSAVFNGNVLSTGGAPATVSFLWDTADRGTNLTLWAHTNVVGVVGTGAVSTNVTGLSAGTTYFYILYAANSGGSSFGTPAQSFTTPAPPVATTLAASAQTLNSATVSGNVYTGSAPTTIAFLWDTSDHVGNPVAWAHTTTPLAVASAGAVSTNLIGLSSSTTYYYILYATNQYGVSYGTNSDGTAHSFATLTPTLGPSVSTAPASGQAPYAATLNGNVGSTGSTATTVFFLYDTADHGASHGGWASTTTPVVVSALGPVTAPISGLIPATTYYYVFYGTNADGESFGTNAVSFATLGLAPTVSTLAADGQAAAGATLHGSVVSTGTAPTTAYFLYDTTDRGTNLSLWAHATAPLAAGSGQGLSTNLTGLALATTYYYVLYASNSVGLAFGTPAQLFTTLALPPTIDALAATNVWSSSACMNGNLTATNGAATTVTLYWGTNDAGTGAAGWSHTNTFGQQAVESLTTNITGLTPLTSYTYRWFASNSAGGTWSTGITFSTSRGLLFDRPATQVQGPWDDSVNNVTLPFSFTFYGVTTNLLRVTSNGGYSLKDASIGSSTYDSSPSPWYNTGYPILAPLWDDLNTGTGNGTYGGLSSVAGVTYTNTYTLTVPGAWSYGNNDSAVSIVFQMSLFGTNASVRLASGHIFAFQSGDIMFCYADNKLTAFKDGQCVVGIGDGVNAAGHFVGMPGTASGVLASANRGLLPTSGEQFVLFRPDATGTNYTSVITNFYVEPIAPTCTTAAATALTTVSATLNGSITSTGNAPTSVYFLWGPADQGTNVALWAHSNAVGVVAGPGAVSTNLTGLTSGATYYYIVYAVSSAGASYGLPAQSFTVPAAPTATTTPATALTVAGATLNGSVTTGTAPTTVWFLWDTADRGPDRTAWAHTNSLGVVGAGGVMTNLANLTAQSTYFCLLYATNVNGESYGMPAQSFTTLTLSTNPSVNTAAATGVTPYAAVLNGSVGSTGASPTTVRFLWDTVDHGANRAAWPQATAPVVVGEGAIAASIGGLNPATTYYFMLYGTNSASASYGTNASGQAASFTTLGLAPTAGTLPADGITTNGAMLHGTVSTGTAPTTVSFLWGPADQGTNLALWANATPATAVSAGPVSANLISLSPGATCYYVLYASNAVGVTFGTPALSFSALALPPVITALSPTNLQPTSATMQGSLAASNGAVTSVTLYWGTNDAGLVAQNWAHTNVFGPQSVGLVATNIAGLIRAGIYCYRWFATNTAGSSWSTSTTFRTSGGMIFDIDSSSGSKAAGDDVAASIPDMGLVFRFYGVTHTNLGLTSNGVLGWPDPMATEYNTTKTPWYNWGAGACKIAPAWSDLNTVTGPYVGKGKIGGMTYGDVYVITYPDSYAWTDANNHMRFQVALIGGTTGVEVMNADGNAFVFRPGDVAFSYDYINTAAFYNGNKAIVGICDGINAAGHYTGAPGTADGTITSLTKGLLPTAPGTFILFRPDLTGTNYTASIESFGPPPPRGAVFTFR